MPTDRLDPYEFNDAIEQFAFDVRAERIRQNQKFRSDVFTSGCHNFGTWSLILGEEVGEAQQAMSDLLFDVPGRADIQLVRSELVQVAAVAAALIERIDRNDPALTAPETYPCYTQRSGNTKSTLTNTCQPVVPSST